MPVDVLCECGWKARVKDEFAGKKIKCRECKTVIQVPIVPEMVAEEEIAYDILTDGPDEKPTPARSTRPSAFEENEEVSRNASPPSRLSGPESRPPKRKKVEIEYRPREQERSRSGISLSPAVAGAIGSILLGIILVAISSERGRIPIYGVALIVLGIFTFIRGLFGGSEE